MKRTLTMERTLTLALISLCVTLCLGSVPGCDTQLYEDEEFEMKYFTRKYSPSARHCQLLCTQDALCKVFSFYTSSRPSKKYFCDMSQGTQTLHRKVTTGVISGFNLRGCPQSKNPCFDEVYDEVVFTNEPYSTLQTNNHKECREKCRQDQSCYFYTYYKSRSECELKFSMPIPTPFIEKRTNVLSGFSDKMKTDFGSGEVCRPEFHVDVELDDGEYGEYGRYGRYGRYGKSYSAISAEHCQALCNIHPQCDIFMFISPGKISSSNRCYMKSSENSKTISIKKPGVISGRAQKGCKVDFSWKDVTFDGVFLSSTLSLVSQPDLKSCQESCNKNPNCLFYSYYTMDYKFSIERKKCYLQQDFTLPMAKAAFKRDAVSGFGMKCNAWKCKLPNE